MPANMLHAHAECDHMGMQPLGIALVLEAILTHVVSSLQKGSGGSGGGSHSRKLIESLPDACR